MKKTILIAMALLFGAAFSFSSCSTSDTDELSGVADATVMHSSVIPDGVSDSHEQSVICKVCGYEPSYYPPPVPPQFMHLTAICKYCGKRYFPEGEPEIVYPGEGPKDEEIHFPGITEGETTAP